jgi:hypothetical protein
MFNEVVLKEKSGKNRSFQWHHILFINELHDFPVKGQNYYLMQQVFLPIASMVQFESLGLK